MAKNAGITNDGLDRIDRDRTVGKLEANDPVARTALLNIARTSGFIDPSVKDIRFVKGPSDAWVIQTSNEDGTFGVITADGSKDPNAPVAEFKSLDDFLAVANVAYNRSVVRQTEFDIAKQNSVTQSLNQRFDLLEQNLEEQGVPPEQRVAINRGVAAGVANIQDPQEQVAFVDSVIQGGAPSAAPETPAAETPAMAPEAEPESRQIGRNRRMRDANKRLANTRAERRRSQLPDEIAAAKADLEQVRADFAERGVEPRRMGAQGELEHPTIQQRKDKITRLEAELVELEPATFTMDTPEDQVAMDQVAEQTKGVPASEVAAKVASGEVTVTPAQQQQVAANLQQQGVETVSDLRNLKSDRDRAMAIASMISAFKGDDATQRALLGQISNVLETGTASMSAKDATDAQLKAGALNARLGELRRGIAQDIEAARATAVESGQDLLNSWNDATQGEYSGRAAATWIQTELAPYLLEAQNAPSNAAADIYLQALNPAVGKILASLAADERGGFAETLISFARGDVSDSSVGATDFNLDRVEGVYETRNGKEVLVGFYYQDANGRRLDEMVSAGRMRRLNEDIYNILSFAANKNRSA